jgi:hypothetical protein
MVIIIKRLLLPKGFNGSRWSASILANLYHLRQAIFEATTNKSVSSETVNYVVMRLQPARPRGPAAEDLPSIIAKLAGEYGHIFFTHMAGSFLATMVFCWLIREQVSLIVEAFHSLKRFHNRIRSMT